MAFWKWGCNFRGMGNPCHADFLEENGIVLGDTNWSNYEPDDLVAVARGFTVFAIARITAAPQPITGLANLHPEAEGYGIAIEDHIVVAPVEWRNVDPTYHLPIQAGHRQVRKHAHVDALTELWYQMQ